MPQKPDYPKWDQFERFECADRTRGALDALLELLAYLFADEEPPKVGTPLDRYASQMKAMLQAHTSTTPGADLLLTMEEGGAVYFTRASLIRFCEKKDLHPSFLFRDARRQSKGNGTAERHARNREQTMGAAFAVLRAYPEQCKNKRSGEVSAQMIAELIDGKSALLWPTKKEPPLGIGKMEKHIREWLKASLNLLPGH